MQFALIQYLCIESEICQVLQPDFMHTDMLNELIINYIKQYNNRFWQVAVSNIPEKFRVTDL